MLVLAAAVAAYVVLRGPGTGQTAADDPGPARPETNQPIRPLGGDAASIVLPPLDESDTVVADLVRKLSSHPQVTAWLTTDGLVRNFAVVVLNVAEGETPNQLVRPLRPSAGFRVSEKNEDLFVDPRSYERYTPLAQAVASIDAKGAASLYTTVKPRLEDAHRELGELETSFDRTLERALVMLLRTPIADGPVRVEPRGIGYGYVDAKREAMPAAQKQLLRMGPENARAVQAKLREIALALGIPSERLPPTTGRD